MKKLHLVTASIIGIFAAGISGILYYQVYTQNCVNESGTITGFLECTRVFEDFISSGEPSKIILSISEPIDSRGLAPLTTTLVYENIEPNTRISERSYEPTNYGERQPRELGTSWDLLPNSFQTRMSIVDENDMDVIDYDVQSTFMRTAALLIMKVTCGDKTIEILSGSSVSVPIKNGTSTVFAKNSVGGLVPNDRGQYVLAFASIFKQEVELPVNAVVLSNTSETCFTLAPTPNRAYYDHVVFELGEK
jgi:hypothetical protein